MDYFYETETVRFDGEAATRSINPQLLLGHRAGADIIDPESNKVLVKKNKKINKLAVRKMSELNMNEIPAQVEDFIGRYLAQDIIHPETGEVLAGLNEEIQRRDAADHDRRRDQ